MMSETVLTQEIKETTDSCVNNSNALHLRPIAIIHHQPFSKQREDEIRTLRRNMCEAWTQSSEGTEMRSIGVPTHQFGLSPDIGGTIQDVGGAQLRSQKTVACDAKHAQPMESSYTGLVNLGNTCFLNACLQVLKGTHELTTILKTSRLRRNNPDKIITKEWLELLELMQSTTGIVSPDQFVFHLQKLAKEKNMELFTGFVQNDMTEFLLFLFDCFHSSIKRSVTLRICGDKKTDVDQIAIDCYEMLRNTYKHDYSPIMEMFYGIYISQIRNLNDTSIVHNSKPELFFILDLPIPVREFSDGMEIQRTSTKCQPQEGITNSENDSSTSIPDITLYDCFNEFIKPDVLEGSNAWYNEKTKSYENVAKSISFFRLPKILVITLKRFCPFSHSKLQSLVTFPVNDLDLSSFVSGYNPTQYKYDLYGVCYHHGNSRGGHYTACVKDVPNNKWVHYNDGQIQFVKNIEHLVMSDAYCLFYRMHEVF